MTFQRPLNITAIIANKSSASLSKPSLYTLKVISIKRNRQTDIFSTSCGNLFIATDVLNFLAFLLMLVDFKLPIFLVFW